MAYYGHIAAFDSVGGVGSISPEDGGNPLAFASADLQRQDCEPEVDQRYCYETFEVNGRKRAIKLRRAGDTNNRQFGYSDAHVRQAQSQRVDG